MGVDLAETLKQSAEDEQPILLDEQEEEEDQHLIAVGVTDVDKKLGGGLPRDTLTLVEGDPDAGKSVMVRHLIFGALKEGYRISVFLSEITPREFLKQMDDLGMDTMDYYLVGRLALFKTNFRVDRDRAEDMLKRMLRHIEHAEEQDIFVVDSITALLFQFDERYVLSFLATCRDLAEEVGTIIVSLHSYSINESLRMRASSIVDAHLRLRIEEMGDQLVRTLEVAKIRGAIKTLNNSVSFSVEPGLGLKSIPISRTKA
jgi:flagellar protein FlaH